MNLTRLYSYSLWAILMLATFVACNKEKDDRSLSLAEYLALGVPPLDSNWTSKEVAVTLKVLMQLKQKDFFSLPTMESERSSQLYKKLVSVENVVATTDKQEMEQILSNFLSLYDDPDFYRRPGYYHKEEAGVCVYYLNLVEGFSKKITYPLDISGEQLGHARRQIEDGYLTLMNGILFYQTDTIALDVNDHVLLSDAISKSVGLRWETMSDAAKQTLTQKLWLIATTHPSGKIRFRYVELLKRLKRPVSALSSA
jgi:hypothetical protein